MDIITKSLLAEFSKTAAIEDLAEESQFEHFTGYLAVADRLPEDFDTHDIVIGAGGDWGIDTIAIIANGKLVTDVDTVDDCISTNGHLDVEFVLVQSERSSNFDTAKLGQFSFGALSFFRHEAPQLPANDDLKRALELKNYIFSKSGKFLRGNPTCRLVYATTGKWVEDKNLVIKASSIRSDLEQLNVFRDVDVSFLDARKLQVIYNQARNAIEREISFPLRVTHPDLAGVSEAYVGLIPALEFLKLITDDGGNLIQSVFYENVRAWQDYNDVNKQIKATLTDTNQMPRFSLFNNGVTIIAKAIRTTGNKFHIEGHQVVNGCQTSHVIYDNRAVITPETLVPIRIIATQNEELVSSIIRATNHQTSIKSEQLLALSEFTKRVESYFAAISEPTKQLFYERRHRQHSTGVEKARVITQGNLVRSFAAFFLGEPHRTTRNFNAILDRVGTDVFGKDHKLEPYYAAATLLYRLESFFRSNRTEARYKAARYHIVYAVRFLLGFEQLPLMNSNQMTKECEKLLATLWSDDIKAVFGAALEIVDEAAAGNFHRDNIRTVAFTNKIKELAAKRFAATSKA